MLMKWYTQTETIDAETGEVLKGRPPKHYYIIKTIKLPTHYGQTYALKKIRYIAQRGHQQANLFS